MDMKAEAFLLALGWPADRVQEAGQARWIGSGSGADGLSQIQATLSRDGSSIRALVAAVTWMEPRRC
jgi:hypothetical protein